jgi:hypothetical protein
MSAAVGGCDVSVMHFACESRFDTINARHFLCCVAKCQEVGTDLALPTYITSSPSSWPTFFVCCGCHGGTLMAMAMTSLMRTMVVGRCVVSRASWLDVWGAGLPSHEGLPRDEIGLAQLSLVLVVVPKLIRGRGMATRWSILCLSW